jgi:hypothetical protein
MHRDNAAYVVALAEQADPALPGPAQRDWLERLERAHPNVRAALTWLVDRGDAARGLRLAVSLCRFWNLSGYRSEIRRWLPVMLARAQRDEATEEWDTIRARAQVVLGLLAFGDADDVETMRHTQQLLTSGLEAANAAGDARDAARAATTLSALARYLGDPAGGAALYDEALDRARSSHDPEALLEVVANFGALFALFLQGEDVRAEALAQEGVDLARTLGLVNVELSIARMLILVALQRASGALAAWKRGAAHAAHRGPTADRMGKRLEQPHILFVIAN